MTNYPYFRNIPGSQNNPSNDQSPMRTNTNSSDSLIAEDHYSFGVTNGGFHKQVRLVDFSTFPLGTINGIGTLYTRLATSTSPSTESNLFYIPDTKPFPQDPDQYQLTRTITGSFPQFGTDLTYGMPADPGRLGGWTFLPGGLLLQYGTQAHTSSTNTSVLFPVAFTTVFSVTTGGEAVGDEDRANIAIRSLSTTGFTAHTTSSSDLTKIHWMAIGV